MALVKCNECGNDVSTDADSCPKCGAKVPKEKKTNWWWVAGPVIVVAVFIMFAVIGGGSSPRSDARAHDRAAIELCWEEQGKLSRDPGEKRFIAGACEMMERKFQEKHGAKP